MKKFFAILLAVVTTLVLLPSCGGGNDTDPTKMTAQEFMRGAKYFMLGNGLGGTLYVVPNRVLDGYNKPVQVKDANGAVIQETASAVQGVINVGSKGGTSSTFQYICYYDANGVPVSAELTISTIPSSNGNDNLVDFFNRATGDEDEEVDLRGVVVLNIDFGTNRFSLTEQRPGAGEGDEPEEVTIGGTVIVQRQ